MAAPNSVDPAQWLREQIETGEPGSVAIDGEDRSPRR